jgi:hypothetical protein
MTQPASCSLVLMVGVSIFVHSLAAQSHQQGSGPTETLRTVPKELQLNDSVVLVKRIDHIVCYYNTIEEVDSMVRTFNGLCGLPQWFMPRIREFAVPPGNRFYNTGVYLGNVFLEFFTYNTQYPSTQTKTYRPYYHAFAFANEITNTVGELDQRGVLRSSPHYFSIGNVQQTLDTLFTNITLQSLYGSSLMIFFCQYHPELFDCSLFDFGDLPPLVNPEDQHPYYRDLLEQKNGGPLTLKDVQNIIVSTTAPSAEAHRSTLTKILLPTVELETGRWRPPSGPELILQSGLQEFRLGAITIAVESLTVAKHFLVSKNLAFEEANGYVKIGLGSSIGVDLYLKDVATSAEYDSESWPKECVLHQNYPNPFNPGTIIKYELPRSSLVSLTVYDILGRKVSVLVDERRDAGVHEVRWDGSHHGSGVYFYRLQAGDFTRTKRFLLLR